MNIPETQYSSTERERIRQFSKEADLEMKIISGIPVFTITTDRRDEVIPKIARFFGENTIFRIINTQFTDDAIEFGTDKNSVDEHDFRRVADGAGYDIWWVEKQALKQGLKRSDVFCGTPYQIFTEVGSNFSSRRLGIPDDRAAILIYDSKKLQEVEDSEKMGFITDGYAFKDVKKKKEALLGIIKFRGFSIGFEKELQALKSIDEKITLLEKEVFQRLNTPDDLKKAPYLSLSIIALLHRESSENVINYSETSTQRINRLKIIANRLKYETKMIGIVDDMTHQIVLTHEAFTNNNKHKMQIMRTWPDFVIKTIQGYLEEMELDQKYITALCQVIKDAEKCNKDLKIGENSILEDLQQKKSLE